MNSNELQLIIEFVRRWTWLLLLGAVIGAGIGYGLSKRTPPVYRASTNMMISQPELSLASDLSRNTDSDLAETFRSMIVLRPVLEAAREKIGDPISAGQIDSTVIEGTSLLNITVQDSSPERAATTANALVASLINHVELLQYGRFEASEESLQAQIDQVESQIAEITPRQEENEIQRQLSEWELADRKQKLKSSILELSNRIAITEQEIVDLTAPEDSPGSAAHNRDLLSKNKAERQLLQLELNSAESQYREMLADGAADDDLQAKQEQIMQLSTQIIMLEWAFDDLSALDPETQESVNDKKAKLALLQLDLDIANARYRQLSLSDGEGDRQDDQISTVQGANLALYQQIYTSLRSHYEAVNLARLQSNPSIVQVDQAVPSGPIQPNAISNALVGAAVGMIALGSIAFLIEHVDDSLKTPEDITAVLDLPVIGFVAQTPEMSARSVDGSGQTGPFVSNNSRSPLAEAFRTLRTNLQFMDVDNPLKTILITSSNPREGKTTISANLASVMGQQQKRVMILDCDLRKPSLHTVFGVSNRTGLSNVLLGNLELQEAVHVTDQELALVTSGTLPSNPAELLGSQRMSRLLEEAVEMSDIVLIDSPPSIVSDAAVLSAMVDGVVVVIQPGHTRSADALALLEQLRRAGARVLGVVLSQIPRKRVGIFARYGNGYPDYSYHTSEDDSNRSTRKAIAGKLLRPFRRKSVTIP